MVSSEKISQWGIVYIVRNINLLNRGNVTHYEITTTRRHSSSSAFIISQVCSKFRYKIGNFLPEKKSRGKLYMHKFQSDVRILFFNLERKKKERQFLLIKKIMHEIRRKEI